MAGIETAARAPAAAREAVAAMHISAPSERNPKLAGLLAAANAERPAEGALARGPGPPSGSA